MNLSSHGVLNLLKPPGMTSHDAVAWARRALRTKRVGHTGTLDPAASGVLPLCVGAATRLVERLQSGTKEYLAEATFGFETDTLDAVGQVVRRCEASGLDRAELAVVLERFRGGIQQQPPLHSAIKIEGRKLYEIARAGETIAIPHRAVTISQLEVTRFWPGENPRAFLRVECSGGTYIRSLVRDIGRELGLAATMTFLTRTRSGDFDLTGAITLAEVEAAPRLLSLEEILSRLSKGVCVDDDLTLRLWQGKLVPVEIEIERAGELVTLCNRERSLFVLAAPAAGPSVGSGEVTVYRAEKVFDLRAV